MADKLNEDEFPLIHVHFKSIVYSGRQMGQTCLLFSEGIKEARASFLCKRSNVLKRNFESLFSSVSCKIGVLI